MVDPMGSDATPGDDSARVLSRAERRKQGITGNKEASLPESPDSLAILPFSEEDKVDSPADLDEGVPERVSSLYDLDWERGEDDVFSERSPVTEEEYALRGEGLEDDFDLLDLPAPLLDPEVYGEGEVYPEDDPDDTGEDHLSDEVVEPISDVGWDIVFPEGEVPRLVVRAALLTEGMVEDSEVPVVESSVELSAEDVDNLLKLAGKVERYHSKESRFGRRIFNWAMRRKFFAGVSFAILVYLGISEIVRAFL
jgi:hypothetical protein